MPPVSVANQWVRAIVNSPSTHAVGNAVGELSVNRLLVLDSIYESIVGSFGQILEHALTVEHKLPVVTVGTLGRGVDGYRFAVESLFHHFKS